MITLHSNALLQSTSNLLRAGQRGTWQDSAQDQPTQALSNLQNKALDALAKAIPGMDAAGLRRSSAEDYTPDKIADRISSYVAAGLQNARAQGKSEEEVQALYESAVEGVEKGFAEAKEILDSLQVLNGSIAEQVAETEQKTFDALDAISPGRQSSESAGVTSASAVGVAAAERYQRADDFQLSLQTREGDRIQVSFSRDFAAQASLAMAADDQGNAALSLDVSRSESSGFYFSVQGDLSADELEAVQNLIHDVGDVANEFFNGDVQKAFDQVSGIAFDSSQLSSMKLQMTRTEQYSAAQRYQQTQNLSNPEQVKSGQLLGHLSNALNQSAQDPALEFLDQARQAVSQIMSGLVEQDTRYQEAATDQQSKYQSNLGRLLESLQNLG